MPGSGEHPTTALETGWPAHSHARSAKIPEPASALTSAPQADAIAPINNLLTVAVPLAGVNRLPIPINPRCSPEIRASKVMAVAYVHGAWAKLRVSSRCSMAGKLAIVYCFVFLYLSISGGGEWSLGPVLSPRRARPIPATPEGVGLVDCTCCLRRPCWL